MRVDGIDNVAVNKSENNTYIKASEKTEDFLFKDVFEESDGNNFFATEESGNSSEVMEQIKDKATVLKDNIEVICEKMETGSAVEIGEDGIDINNTEVEEVVTVVEQIQMKLAMYCDDFVPTVDIDPSNANATAEQIQIANAIKTVEDVGKVTDETKAYILRNNLKPTIKNLYIANHSGEKNTARRLTEYQWNQMKPQVEDIASHAGIHDTKLADKQGRWMIENGIEVTVENFETLNEMGDIEERPESRYLTNRIKSTIMEGYAPADTILTGKKLPWENTVQAIDTLEKMTDADVVALVDSGMKVNLENLAKVEKDNTNTDSETVEKGVVEINYSEETKYCKAARQLQEIRLMMTLEAGRTLEKNGVSINTEEISKLVEELRNYEMQAVSGKIPEDSPEVTYEEVKQTNSIMLAVDNLKTAPSAVIGSFNEGEEVSFEKISANVDAVTEKIKLAGEAYEALSTEIRSDLGDSVSKAIKASTGDILSDMGYEDNEANRRAVRIIAYNQLEMTPENIDRIKNLDYTVNRLFRNMTPEGTLQLIRDNINPMEMSVEELNKYYMDNQSSYKAAEEKYSEFLYRLDKKGGITAEERAKYIGIYSLVNTFENDGLNVVGSVLNQGLELNMGNLLSAYMTSKDKGMDLKAEDGEQKINVNDKVSYFKNLFADVSDKVTPQKLSDIEGETDSMSVEEFAGKMDEMEIPEDDEVYRQYMDTVKEAADLEDSIFKMITSYEIPATFNNLFAAQTVIQKPSDIFGKYETESDDEDYEEKLFEALESKDELKQEYNDILEKTKAIVDAAVYKENSYINMDELRRLGSNMSMINSLAQQNNFYIPYETENGKAVINLKIIEDGDNKGRFNIKYRDSQAGRITIDGKIVEKNIMAMVMCENKEGVELINNSCQEIEAELRKQGYTRVTISAGHVTDQPDVKSQSKDSVSANAVFKAAKTFITKLAK